MSFVHRVIPSIICLLGGREGGMREEGWGLGWGVGGRG